MNTLVVLAHPRRISLSGSVADIFASEIKNNGHNVEWADLVREKFDPVLLEQDEPVLSNPQKHYSPSVQHEMERVERNDAKEVLFQFVFILLPRSA